ncbi:hypothetical protein [Lactococcus taiwanensis]|uniref:hypothetical protein n=1 Tax=Lactococcus taiwanensis TaxID=1151742 RepID=UPI0023F50838|nr:hypothetical protein [Lactococcus taiwanensis]
MDTKYLTQVVQELTKQTKPMADELERIDELISEATQQLKNLEASKSEGTVEERIQKKERVASLTGVIDELKGEKEELDKAWEDFWTTTETTNQLNNAVGSYRSQSSPTEQKLKKELKSSLIPKNFKKILKNYDVELDDIKAIVTKYTPYLRNVQGPHRNDIVLNLNKIADENGKQLVYFDLAKELTKEFEHQIFETLAKEKLINNYPYWYKPRK